ncbi:MAG: AMP-binding protein [Desulfatiglandales bacterium]
MNFARFSGLNASKYPNREFIIESYPSKNQRRAITWKEYNEKANKVANYLIKECGIKKGDIVLHLMMNSIEWHLTYMAVLKAGAVITPLNFRFASSDIKYAADVARCKAFILGDGFVPKVKPIMGEMDYCKKFICVGENVPEGMISYDDIIRDGDPSEVCLDVDEDDMAELMFTSGTTGAPKPVCHTHKTLFYIGIGNALTYGEGYESVYLAPIPFTTVGPSFCLFLPL